jgi:hypothetical protein
MQTPRCHGAWGGVPWVTLQAAATESGLHGFLPGSSPVIDYLEHSL